MNKITIDGQVITVNGNSLHISKRKSKLLIITSIIAVIALIIVVILSLRGCEKLSNSLQTVPDENSVVWDGEQFIKNPNTNTYKGSYIPGFDVLNLVADSKSQKVNFYNPESNTCNFKMFLFIENELVWQSGYVKPGYGFYEIELSHEFSARETTGVLKVECYSGQTNQLTKSVNIQCNVVIY